MGNDITDESTRKANRKRAAEAAPAVPSKPSIGPAASGYHAFGRATDGLVINPKTRGISFALTANTGADMGGAHPEQNDDVLKNRLYFLYNIGAIGAVLGLGNETAIQREFDVRLYTWDPKISEQLAIGVHEGGGGPDGGGFPRHVSYQDVAYAVMTGELAIQAQHAANAPVHVCPCGCSLTVVPPVAPAPGIFRAQCDALKASTLKDRVLKYRESLGYKPAGPSGDVADGPTGSDPGTIGPAKG